MIEQSRQINRIKQTTLLKFTLIKKRNLSYIQLKNNNKYIKECIVNYVQVNKNDLN